MPQRHEWLHATRAKSFNYLAVMLDFFFIPLPFFGLDARPFDGKPVHVVPKRLCDIKILFITVIVVARAPGNIICGILRLRFDIRPIRKMVEFLFRLLCEAFRLQPGGSTWLNPIKILLETRLNFCAFRNYCYSFCFTLACIYCTKT